MTRGDGGMVFFAEELKHHPTWTVGRKMYSFTQHFVKSYYVQNAHFILSGTKHKKTGRDARPTLRVRHNPLFPEVWALVI